MTARRAFLLLAALHVLGAAIHFTWPLELAAGADAAGVARPYRQLLLLAVASTGVLLATLGGLSAWFASGERWRGPGARGFALAGALAWAGRAALELVFPVELRLFGVGGVSPAVLAGSVVVLALFVVAWRGAGGGDGGDGDGARSATQAAR